MLIQHAQHDVRTIFMHGFPGQLIASLIWFLSAACATWHSTTSAILILTIGGIFIFPLTQLSLRLSGRPAALAKGHPMNQLATQVAFTLPLNLPLVAAATAYHLNWFYPAFMIALGAHYLPFVFLYGMPQFAVLAGVLLSAGVLIGLHGAAMFSIGGWVTAVTLLLFALLAQHAAASSRITGAPAS